MSEPFADLADSLAVSEPVADLADSLAVSEPFADLPDNLAVSEPVADLADRLARLEAAISRACDEAGRDRATVRLLPVSKAHSSQRIEAAIKLGYRQFGENRVQELVAKAKVLPSALSWVLIGHLQRNKVGPACAVIDELQSLDSLALAQTLQWHLALRSPKRRLVVLIEVNTSGEATKSGLAPDQVLDFTTALKAFPALDPRGLMTVAHPDPALAEAGFAELAKLRRQLQDRDGGGWAELSMGMTGDFAAAIRHGSTCIRIGSAIFGPR